jgi:hypothetical protein
MSEKIMLLKGTPSEKEHSQGDFFKIMQFATKKIGPKWPTSWELGLSEGKNMLLVARAQKRFPDARARKSLKMQCKQQEVETTMRAPSLNIHPMSEIRS